MPGSSRHFGIITSTSGITQGIIVNNLTTNKQLQTAEARDQKGRILDVAAYSQNETLSVDGLMTGSGVTPGYAVRFGDKNYLITGAQQTEANTDFVKQSMECRTADPAGYIWEIDTESGDNAVPVTPENP